MRYLALIPARGGSKGIQHKNLQICAGKPLVVWTIETALKVFDEVVVSTDDHVIAGVARFCGAKVIRRPPSISLDNSTTEEAVIHALTDEDAIVLLQPTSPLRTAEDIRGSLLLFEQGFDSVVSVTKVNGHCPWQRMPNGEYLPLYDISHRPRRQFAATYYMENGAVYISKAENYTNHNNRLYGTIGYWTMPIKRSIDIDTIEDLREAEKILESKCQNQR